MRDILAPLVSGQQLKPANIFAGIGNVPQTVEGWDGGCGIDYATLRSWSMLDFEGERFRAAASTQ
ncbi:hypothetical protein QZM64_41270, partial [Burkholderia cepacia]|uniref:hypothetical protein n=1 Tax=Burkholderia cepacia TaxID=292 RepID=UPI00264ED5FF